ncbi:hypothetical protein [Winogradskyella sediminis]|uniref:Outer membrane protein beta-barrel domain-containing protein n=1 Tax=Winogradskyella sediminis TaxID=1382466 RepID=A0A1H1NEA8_9FLAO|nr:hypothetical protein [Winogradskyella sediminis]SDR97298.1 hypothetical protein SAMN04489797_0579 [Winogradskyella sediminis]
MKKHLILLIIILSSNLTEAQFIKEKSINALIGYGISVPYYSSDDFADTGFFVQGELVLKVYSWLEIKPYAGLMLTNSNGKDFNDNPTNEKAETKAFLTGGKVRLRAPIPWIAPYIEIGLGASIGKFETITAFTDINKSGIIYHIPIAFGLELGKNNNFDLGFSYYAQPSVEQDAGGFTIGISFLIKN